MSIRQHNNLKANIRKFSAGNDNHLAAESAGSNGGACTSAFLKAVQVSSSSSPPPTFMNVLKSMNESMMEQKLAQRPILSYSLQNQDPSDKIFQIVPPQQSKNNKGKRRALLIGINYKGIPNIEELDGSHEDVFAIQDFIIKEQGFMKEDINLLMDDGVNDAPTSENIYKGFYNLTNECEENDCVFVHFSGHAFQVADKNNDEEDHLDEVLVPIDTENSILDDYLYEYIFCKFKKGVTVTCLIDSCHSGSLFDLPYQKSSSADGGVHTWGSSHH